MKKKFYKNKTDLLEDLVHDGQSVLDVGFWGQGVSITDQNWVHNILLSQTNEVYGLDLDFDMSKLDRPSMYYQKSSAEHFLFDKPFDIIFAGDLIEHLSNPGLFLDACRKNLADNGVLILTTPNCFNLFNITEKLSKGEPTVNKDHTCYFNSKTLTQLLEKNGWEVDTLTYLYTLEVKYKQSLKKRFLNIVYKSLSKFTTKYMVDLVVVARIKK